MPNIDAPRGAIPVMHLDGSPWNGKVNMYLVPSADATALFVGDFVKSHGSAGAEGLVVNGQDVWGMPTVIQAAAGNTLRGVVVGFLPNQSDLSVRHRVASTNRIALVADGPDVVFEIQEDSDGGALAVTDIGENADIVVGTGSSTTGQSAMELDSSTHTTGSANLRILGLVKKVDNGIGTNAKFLVVINEHELKSTSGV
jgi:hypothetical protein